jgi:hypothetical protein
MRGSTCKLWPAPSSAIQTAYSNAEKGNPMYLSTRLLFLAALTLCLGCSSTPGPVREGPTLQEHIAQRQANLNSAIGKLRYDEAISRWGQPTRVVDGDKIRSALWRHEFDGGTVAVPDPIYLAPMYVERESHGEQMDMIISKGTGLLQSIRYSAW